MKGLFVIHRRLFRTTLLASVALLIGAGLSPLADGQQSDDLNLPANSPFRNPDIIYLEADEVEDNREAGIITAKGGVEGRYQDRTLRADRVVYNVVSGRVMATGNVVLIDGDGASQYADKLELTDKLASGGAKDFTARFNPVGIAGAKYAVRRSDSGFDLYNAYYTACETCTEDGVDKTPTWRVRARKVTQDVDDKMIHYRDAVVEVKGVPVLYLPYLAHPDPSTERRSGWLIPFAGRSGSYGVFYEQPYYWAINDYSELTVTPRLMERVNPFVMGQYSKRFYSGQLEVDASLAYDSFFDNDGDGFSSNDVFSQPEFGLQDETWRSHLFARGQFDLTDSLMWGFGYDTASDDFYLDRYDIDTLGTNFGLYDGGSRRLTQQLYGVAQKQDYRYSASAYSFQSLRSSIRRDATTPTNITINREDDDALPKVLPKLEMSHYLTDPIFGGRFHAFGDAVQIKRSVDGTVTTPINDDYRRVSFGGEYSKSMILPFGVEAKPFAMARYDKFNIDPLGAASVEEDRAIGQVGLDARWTLVRPGNSVDFTIEPRVQISHNFGDDTPAALTTYREDSIGIDLDSALLWASNKATGYDLWETGTRADIGASFAADWDDNHAGIFLGQSFTDQRISLFGINSGLNDKSSNIVSEIDLQLGGNFTALSRLRYDNDEGEIRRADTQFSYAGDRLTLSARHYKINDPFSALATSVIDAPPEELSGSIKYQVMKDWAVRYVASRDVDAGLTRREELAFIFDDDCTYMELYYEKRRNNLGLIGDNTNIGIRVALLTLGDVRPE